jgi:hypothetical protein
VEVLEKNSEETEKGGGWHFHLLVVEYMEGKE